MAGAEGVTDEASEIIAEVAVEGVSGEKTGIATTLNVDDITKQIPLPPTIYR